MNERVKEAIRKYAEDKAKVDRINARMEESRNLIKRYVLHKGRTITVDDTTCSFVRNTSYAFDVGKMIVKIPAKVYKRFISHRIEFDVTALKKLCRENGIDYRIFESAGVTVYKLDEKTLSSMIEKGEIELADLAGCYTLEEKPTVSIRVAK